MPTPPTTNPITLTAGGAPVTNAFSTASVTVGGTAPPVGSVLTFSLVVTDEAGDSAPATCTVTVIGKPTATLTGPSIVAAGTPINLVGVGTPQGGGTISSYTWTLTSVKTPG
ncbi:MAG: hypothetical protein WB615_00340 [Candidatus Tumulicola sp.]